MATENLKERKIYRVLTNVSTKAWDKIAFWTTAKSVDAADGKDLQTKVGAINGITSDVSGTATDVAASIKVVNTLNKSLVSNVYVGSDGKLRVTKGGADTVLNFSKSFSSSYEPRELVPTPIPKNNVVTTVNAYKNDILCVYGLNLSLNQMVFTNTTPIFEMAWNGDSISSLSFHTVTSDKPTFKSTHTYNNALVYILKPKV